MNYKKVLTIQDISCVGQCSLTVALPILSCTGQETCILPSAVLSTHTAGFTGFTVRDLTDDMPGIEAHWMKEGISFDCVYTGYLGSQKQIDYVKHIMANTLKKEGVKIVDPAMADGGNLYPAFDMDYVEGMKALIAVSDIVLPNITEAAFLTGIEYKENYDEAYVKELTDGLVALGAKAVVLTGVSFAEDKTGVYTFDGKNYGYYEHFKYEKGCHGTGDVYASAFVGAYMKGKSLEESAKIAADYTLRCIEITQGDADHWYGVKFELALPYLVELLGE